LNRSAPFSILLKPPQEREFKKLRVSCATLRRSPFVRSPMRRSTILLTIALTAIVGIGRGLAAVAVEGKDQALHGIYKAVAHDNRTATPGIDGKFNFQPDGTFFYARKTATDTIVTKGVYNFDGAQVTLIKGKGQSNWPQFWDSPAIMTVTPSGDLQMKGLTYAASLIGKVFVPGRYLCPNAPANHYYFSPTGGYKYKGQATSTGEYWVEKTPDPTNGQEKITLVLNILRIDGKRVSFHQLVDLDADGGFTLDGKYKYRRAAEIAPTTNDAKTPTTSATEPKTSTDAAP